MLLPLVLLFASALAAPTCPRPSNPDRPKPESCEYKIGQTYNATITSSGNDRWFLFTLPEKYFDQVYSPLIFSFHGATRTASNQQELSQLSNPYFNDIAVAVYPQGIDQFWTGSPDAVEGANDVQFVSDIIDYLNDRLSIDDNRIWATGKSQGGGMVGVLACDPVLSTKIAAFAPVSGAFYVPLQGGQTCDPETIAISCNPGRPKVPILDFHGESDHTINYYGGLRKGWCLPTIPHWTQNWARLNGFSATNASALFTAETKSEAYFFGQGAEFGLLTQISSPPNGHYWPSTFINPDTQASGSIMDFNATSIIMDFFVQHSL